MTERQEPRIISKDKETAKKRLLSLLRLHPQVFQAGMGAEMFVKEFIKVFTKYVTFSDDEIFAMEEISRFIGEHPQVIRPETAAELFLEDLHKASVIFLEYFSKPKIKES